jgi:protein TonB
VECLLRLRQGSAISIAASPEPPVIMNSIRISRGGLNYPDRAAERDIGGYVDFSFVIEPDGSVGDARVIDEAPEGYGFAAAARKAFTTWRLRPKMVDGHPVAAAARIRVSFKLQ